MASDIKYNVKGSISTNTKRGVIGSSGTYDHTKLNNRDAADQHPIQAITGLVDYLNNFSNKIQEIIQGLIDSDFQGQINRLNAQVLSLIDYLPSAVSSSNKLVDQNQLNTRINEINETINQLNIDLSQDISQLDTRLTNSIQELSESFTENLHILSETLNSFEESITNSLRQEILDREAADQQLSDYVDTEIEKLDEKIKNDLEPRLTELSDAIDSEENRAQEAENTLDTKINKEVSDRNAAIDAMLEYVNNADEELQNNIDAEETARQNADTVLQNNISAEETRASAAEQGLQDNIDAEAQARSDADTTLQQNIDAEASRAQDAESDLQDNIDAEAQARQQADSNLDTKINKVANDLSDEVTARQNADAELREQIDNISIEELSKRTTYRTLLPENPSKNDKFVLVEEYTEGLNYYKQTYDVDTTKLNGMWQVDETKLRAFTWDELNELMDGEASFWWNVNCYWYNNNIKKSFSRLGLIIPSGTFVTWALGQDLYGFGLTNKFYSGNSEYSAIGNLHDTDRGVIALPVRHTRDYDFQSELGYKDVDYNPLGEPGLYPSNFKTLYFNITKETTTTKAIAKLMSAIAIKVSDENLELGNTNYKMKFVPATVTAETFEPNTYYYYDENFEQEFIKTNVIKSSGYYPAYEFNSENTYYKQVYDVDDTKLYGMWELPLAPNYIGDWPDWAFGWINETRGYFYHDDGTREDFYRTGALMPAYRETDNQCWGFAIGDGWNGQYGIQEQGRYIYPDKSGADMGAGWAFGLNDWDQPDAKRILYYTETNTTFANGFKATGAIKVSDALLPFGDYNYKTKYVQVEVDETTFEPGKYYTYFDKEADEQNEVNFIVNTKNYIENTPYYEIAYIDKVSNEPVYRKVTLTESEFYSGLQDHNYYRLVTLTAQPEEYVVTRIQLDSDKSIYRDVLGNNLVEITDDNVIVGGENLIPNLTINKEKITTVTLENNAETVFEKPIENLIIEIPNNLKHGFCSFLSFETAKTDVSVSFNTVYANKPLKFIFAGATVKEAELDFATETQYNLMFLCNGIYLEVYIQEIQLI